LLLSISRSVAGSLRESPGHGIPLRGHKRADD
jgi:hypothetical protein